MDTSSITLYLFIFSLLLLFLFSWKLQALFLRNARFKKLTYLAASFGILLAASLSVPYLAFAQGDPTLPITKSFGGSNAIEVESGEEFTYFINYRCASVLNDCVNAVITDVIPSELEFISATGPLSDIDSINYLSETLTVDFVNPLGDGKTGIIEILVRFPPGTLPGTTADNTATSSTDGGLETSGTVRATATGAYEMFVDKTVVGDFDDTVIGSDFTTNYQLQVCNPDDEGGVRLTNPVIVDTLPPEATFVSASNGGVYSALDHTITWTAPDLPDPIPVVDGCSITLDVAVRFDENGRDGSPGGGDDPVDGGTTINTMRLTGTPEDGSPDIDLVDPVGITFTLPSFGDGVSKSSFSPSSYIGRPTEELPGGDVTYSISYNNSGTITATNVILTDTIPPEVFVSSIGITPVVSDALGFYETNDAPGVWIPFPGNGYSSTATLVFTDTTGTANPNDIELAANDYLTRIRWEIGEVPFDSPTWSVGIGTFIKPTVPVSTTFQNCVSYLSEYNDGSVQTATGTACDDVTTIETRAIPRVDKTSTESSGLPGTINEYTIRAYNANVAHNDIEGPIVVADFLPARLELVVADAGESSGYRVPTIGEITAGNWYSFTSSNGAIAPTHTYTESFNAANDTLLSWEFAAPYSIPPGDYIDIVFHARIRDYTVPQQLDNRAAILVDPSTLRALACDASDGNNAYTDSDDVDNDSNASETGCTESDPFNVTAFLAMDSEKSVLGELDSVYSDYGYTVAGGQVDYRKTISNTSNVTATNIVAYDIFPYVGDTGVIDPSPRGSEWAPHLISPITDTQGLSVTIEYSLSTNPCRPEIIPSGPAGCVDDWSETPPPDITSVKAVRLEFCDSDGQCVELAPDDGGGGGALTFGWHMVAPNSTPEGEVAWNSFGFSAEGGGLTLLPSEPVRVGIELAPNPNPGVDVGNYVWLDVFGQQNDGVQQPEEEGINGVRVELWDDTTGMLVDFRTTGPDASGNLGYYQFNNVITGTYSIRFYPPITGTNGLPITYTASIANNGGDSVDSDGETSAVDPTYGTYYETAAFNVASADDFTWDQGFWLPTDYGDAPATYPTEAASQGNPADAARHIIDPNNLIFLGGGVDPELDGQPDSDALGDDTGGDDEDGVGFETYIGTAAEPSGILTIGENTSIDISTVLLNHTVISTTVPITGFLNAWIDYDGNGSWDPSEQILDDVPVTNGSVNYPISVPSGATPGTTYARFRLSTEPGLQPTGGAPDGEVEDYKVQILPTPEKYLFDTSADHTSGSDVTIGEIITYHLEIPVPEGTINTFVVRDNLPGRLRYVDTITPTVFITATTGITIEQFVITPGSFSGGIDPIFNLGTVTNQDSDAGVEYINILISAVVENVSGNQEGTNRNNRFTVSWDNGYNVQTDQVRVDLVEPDLTISKDLVTPLADPLDAGSSVTYEIVVSHTGTSDIEAKDVLITDTFPTELTNITIDSITASGVAAPTADVAGNLVTIPDSGSFHMPLGSVITLTVSADIAQSIESEELVSNTVDLTWTSIEGPSDDERDGSGGIDDYSDSDSDDFTSDGPSVGKTLVDTSAAHTLGNTVTIGEVVTYSVSITLPESTIPSAVITDSIPAGMDYIANSVTVDTSSLNGSTPTISESGGAGSGDDVVFTLGSFNVISDNVTTNNTIVLIYEAVVLNESANVGVSPYTNLTNEATVQIGSNPPYPTNQVTVIVEEPVLDITKSIVAPLAGPIDAGDTITYQIVLEHDGLSELDAFDVVLTDTLPAELTNVDVASIAASGIVTPTFDDTGNVVRVPNTGSIDLPFGAVITLTITADVAQGIVAEEVVTNRSNAVWSTLPGSDPNERDGGGDTPDNSDLYDDGTLNDYEVTSSVPFTAADPTVSKALVGTSAAHTTGITVTIGEVVTYSVSITLPESTIPSAVIIDDIPDGMAYITNSVVIDASGLNGTTPTISDSNAGGSGDDVTFTLGNFTVTNDNNPANNTIALVYQAVVLNESANIGVNPPGYTNLINDATVQIGSNTPLPTNQVIVTVEEPVLDITKSIVAPLTGSIDAGDTITYQIVLAHDALSELDAFDVVLTDTLPSSLSSVSIENVEVMGILNPGHSPITNTFTIPASGSFDFPMGSVITVTVSAVVNPTISPNQVITNKSNAVWSTLPGADPNERDGGGNTPDDNDLYDDGALDDYETSSSVSIPVNAPELMKTLIDTSASHTAGTNVTIGEVVTYSIALALPESVISSIVITDNLPAGMSYVTGTVALDISSFNGTTPTLNESSTGGSGDDMTFTLGSFTVTNDNDPNNNILALTYQALVVNELANVGVAPGNRDLVNTADVQIENATPITTDPFTVTVSEPVLDIAKTILAPTSGSIDAGDTITYQLVISHDSLSELNAYDVVITDTFPAELTNVALESVAASGVITPTPDVNGNVVTVPASGSIDLPLGAVITLTLTADVDQSVLPGATITNSSNVVWSTLNGPDPNERDGGGDTPDDTDLYDDGSLDDYEETSSDSFTTDSYSSSKGLVTTSAGHTAGNNVTIGEIVTYTVSIVLPESTIPSITIIDNIPAGMAYVTNTVAIDGSTGFNGSTPTISDSSAGGSGDDVTFNIGSFTVTNDNNPANNTFAITYQAVVMDVVGNVGLTPPGQTVLLNTASVQVGTDPASDTDPVTVTAVEPQLIIDKAFDREQAERNSTVTVTLRVTNTGTSTAFDVIIDDPIDNSEFVTLTEGTTPAGFTYAEVPSGGDTIVRYSGGPIPVGATVEFTFLGTLAGDLPPSPPNITNVATVTQHTTLDSTVDDGDDSQERDEPDVSDSDDLTINVHDLVLNKDDGRTGVKHGDTVTYTLTVTNVGNAVAPNAYITDTVPVSTTFRGPAGWTCINGAPAGTLCAFALGNMAPGAVETVEFIVEVDSPLPNFADSITNSATTGTDGSQGDDPTPGNNTDDDVDIILASIGDLVWDDTNGDGIKDGGENGVGGITVTLYTSGGAVISTTQTAPDGSYLFEGITPQDVFVEFTLPISYTFSPADQGVDTLDSDPNITTGRTVTTTLSNGEIDLTWDAGIYVPASIGDFVWDDTNADGIQDGGSEVGIGGITVTLYASNNSVISTTVTAPDGSYLFDDLRPQDVYIEFTYPPTYTVSPQDAGSDDALDSDIDPTTNRTITTTLESGENDLDWDAGLYIPASIGDVVWLDVDGDGIQDGGAEVGIGGVTVTLYASDNSVITTTVTAPDGSYLFDNLVPQDVYLEFSYPPTYTLTLQDQGGDSTDSDVDLATGQTVTTTLDSGENDLDWDAGLYIPASLGDLVWLDTNADGIKDGTENGIGGITVTLYASDNSVITTTVTAPDGSYLFDNLRPQEVYVVFTPPPTLTISIQDQGGDLIDSDANPTTGQTINTTLISGENDLSWDAGVHELASIGDFVWLDVNGDGIQDGGGEVGVGGITVTLYASDNSVITTTVTAPDGSYLFDDITPQDVYVGFTLPPTYTHSSPGQGGNPLLDSDPNPATGLTITTTLSSGENDLSWDAGIYEGASIGDFVWEDTNGDGIQNLLEDGIGGITVTLYASDNSVISTTVTAPDGSYLFDNLQPQDVYIGFTYPPTYTVSPQDVGSDGLDSDIDPLTNRTITTTLESGENDLDWDAGLYIPASIGDFVWLDVDGDGVQDGGSEVGIGGITVTLYASDNSVITTTVTAPDGSYLFDNLVPQVVYLEFSYPPTYTLTLQDQGGDSTDSDVDLATSQTVTTTLDSGENDLDWDAGLYVPASLGDLVWLDTNADGIKDVTENGIGGITVTLYASDNSVITTTVTAPDGSYLFDNLRPQEVYVVFTPPPTLTISLQDQGGDLIDSDANPVNGQTINTTLVSGENDLSWDAGVHELASIGDFVWLDVNGDGIQDGGSEVGVGGITVTLYASDNSVITTTVTAPDGSYLFDDLTPQDVYVGFTLPPTYTHSAPNQGGNPLLDSDPNPVTGLTITTTLSSGEDDLSWDAGIFIPASIGDYVWYDADNDGVQDVGEPGLFSITVTLYTSAGAFVTDTVTAADGSYGFDNLPPGDYYVEVTPPAGYVTSPIDQGGDDTTDSDVNGAGRTAATSLSSGENDPTWDAGLYADPAAIGDTVWLDADQDGLQDSDEYGIEDVVVNLYDYAGNFITTTTTAADGTYLFDGLPPFDYYVEVIPPAGYTITGQDAGDDALDSDIDGAGLTVVTTLDPNETDLTWDAGLHIPPASLGDRIWLDANQDGIQDPGEFGVSGVTVELYNDDGVLIDTTVTDSLGNYEFINLPPGDYYVDVLPPAGYTIVPEGAGSDPTADSNIDPVTGETDVITLASGENNPTLDGGLFIQPAEIGNYVWLDADLSGQLDFNESGVSGVMVNLYDSTGTRLDTTLTDPDGFYLFDNLPPGDYYVEAIKPNGFAFTGQDVGDDALDSDVDQTTGIAITTTLTAGESDLTWDIGLVPANAELGDYVWEDLDGNGVINVGEPAVPNVVVNLYDGAGNFLGTTTTDADGLYLFSGLEPGDFYVEFVPPAGFEFTTPISGTDTTIDSDADPVTGQTVPTTLTPGESDVTWDAGLIRTPVDPLLASLGNYVWLDEDSNGLQGPQEPGVPNITVTLYNITGTVVATTTTDADGLYQFANLQPDTYSVGFTLPVSHTFTTQDVPADDTIDSDADPITGLTITTTLTAGDNDVTWDAGIIAPQDPLLAAIGNFVWIDADSDGIQDSGEAGIEGVTVTLYDSGGVVRGITTTDPDGLYEFVDLAPGDYYVDFSVPTGYTLTAQNAGSDVGLDSDADLITGQTITTTLVAGENDLSWDAGVTPILDPALAAIGNFIWSDLDGDGVQDPGEPGVGSVQVNLYTSAGVLTGTTQTDANGLYEFIDLIPGDYYVEVIPPFDMEITAQDTITDDLDSDADPVTGIMITTTLSAGENDTTWDAGLIPSTPDPLLAEIGNFVWLDADQDGMQDVGEAGVPNIMVTLYNITGTAVATTTTDANGLYIFTDLAPDDYVVEFGIPAVYTVTAQNAGTDPALDSDVDPTTGRTITTTLTAGESDLSWDLGLYQPLPPTEAAYGNFVWLDNDQDGIQDLGEPGIAGVTVILYDATNTAVMTTTTDANGGYEFTGLTPGDYYAEVIRPDGYVFTEQGQGGDDGADSDADADEASPTYGQMVLTNLTGGENDTSWDAGLYLPTPPATATLGDFIWEDLDVDGIQDPGEPGVGGVTVNLYDSDGNLVDTTTTDPDGFYQFEDLLPGDYYVEILPPDGYDITVPDAGSDELGDSDANPLTGQTITTTLTAGENDPTWDTGLFQTLRLGNVIWNDLTHDGVFDPATEPPVPGVVVELLDGNGIPFVHPITGLVMTTTTNIDGEYLFEDLPAGTYIVNIPSSNFDQQGDPLFGFVSSLSDQAVDPAADPDVDGSDNDDNGVNAPRPAITGISSLPVTLEPGGEPVSDAADEDGSYDDDNSNLTVDFGFFELLSLGNQIWFDENGNGVFETGEPTVGAGVILYLLDGDGNPILDPLSGQPITTTTSTDGTYLFTNLYPGEYRVQVGPENFEAGAPLEGYASSTGNSDPDDDADGDDNGEDTDDLLLQGIISDPVTLAYEAETIGDEDSDGNNNTNLTVDFGLVLLPTAVELISFTAARLDASRIQVRWETGSEINNFGFRLLRSSDGNLSSATQIHFEDSAVTSGPGAVYTFVDADLQPGTYTYWLVDVETTGVETVHGPVTFTLGRNWTIYLPLTSR